MSMKLPGVKDYGNTLVVGKGEDQDAWDVRFCRKLPDDCLGMSDPSVQRIMIKLKQTRSEIFETFIHEVVHMIEDKYDISVPHGQVYKFEKAFAEFFVANWDYFAALIVQPKPISVLQSKPVE